MSKAIFIIANVSSFKDLKPDAVEYANGELYVKDDKSDSYRIKKVSLIDLMRQADKPLIEIIKDSARATAEAQKYAMNSFSVGVRTMGAMCFHMYSKSYPACGLKSRARRVACQGRGFFW